MVPWLLSTSRDCSGLFRPKLRPHHTRITVIRAEIMPRMFTFQEKTIHIKRIPISCEFALIPVPNSDMFFDRAFMFGFGAAAAEPPRTLVQRPLYASRDAPRLSPRVKKQPLRVPFCFAVLPKSLRRLAQLRRYAARSHKLLAKHHTRRARRPRWQMGLPRPPCAEHGCTKVARQKGGVSTWCKRHTTWHANCAKLRQVLESAWNSAIYARSQLGRWILR